MEAPFERVAIIGVGLIGSSLARVIRREGLAKIIVGIERDAATAARVRVLSIMDDVTTDLAAVAGADLVIICTPVGVIGSVGAAMAPHLSPGVIVTDVGSVKQSVIAQLTPVLPAHARLMAGHPIAGTENSGPESGFPDLFKGRLCIITPLPETDPDATRRVRWLWEQAGSQVTEMAPDRHDRVLAVTSHLPHLIAYTIVATAADLEEHMQGDVIKYSAGGFRDFTRIAASDPVMWRDVFLHNREAVLEMLGRLYEDIAILQRAIRLGDGDVLETHFTRSRAIRRGVVALKQD
jgi:cyclohexadieny/prephenate dehydrogenase